MKDRYMPPRASSDFPWDFQLSRMFPVLKIPCILATTLALHVGITSPNLPPSESERVVKIDTLMSDGFIGLFGHLHYNPVIKVSELLSS